VITLSLLESGNYLWQLEKNCHAKSAIIHGGTPGSSRSKPRVAEFVETETGEPDV
jgi:hypothetical protein